MLYRYRIGFKRGNEHEYHVSFVITARNPLNAIEQACREFKKKYEETDIKTVLIMGDPIPDEKRKRQKYYKKKKEEKNKVYIVRDVDISY